MTKSIKMEGNCHCGGWEGMDDHVVADKLADAAAATKEWAANSGVVFDHGKAEAALP
jgi:hypothetical protein